LLKENKERDKMFKSILTGYIDSALSHAEYDKLEDGTIWYNMGVS